MRASQLVARPIELRLPRCEHLAPFARLGFELVDTHVCAAAQTMVGNLLTPFAQGVCYERDGLRGAAIAAGETPLPACQDLYSRSSELKGVRWF